MKRSHIKDFYFHKAKREKYSARSIYKLRNIQERYHLISKGNKVLDIGASPGSWSEYVSELIGPDGALWALDQKPLSISTKQKLEKARLNFQFLEQSIFDDLPSDLPEFDAVISDIAPATAGSKFVDSMRSLELVKRCFEVAQKHLKKGGHFVVKLFQSEEAVQTTREWEAQFRFSKLYRPPSTPKESKEIYFVGQHFKP